MKNILVTGAGGFIGSHLCELLIEKGYNVTAFLKYNSTNSIGWLNELKCSSNIRKVFGNIRDYDSVLNAVKGNDSVFHLAALIGIPYSYVSPLAYLKTNIEGTYNILQASTNMDVENIIITSTSETYGTAQYIPIDEKHPIIGQSPYSASKIAADQLAISFYRSFGTPIKIVRPFNTYGPRQSARAIIPTIIAQVLNGSKVIKLGNLFPTRDLNYVKDIVNGFLAIADNLELFGEVTNIGTGFEISVKDLAELISELLGKDLILASDELRKRPTNSEVDRLFCDNSKITSLTGWHPEYDLRKGLTETIKWLEKKISLFQPDNYNV